MPVWIVLWAHFIIVVHTLWTCTRLPRFVCSLIIFHKWKKRKKRRWWWNIMQARTAVQKKGNKTQKKNYERERFSGFLHEFFECFWAHQHSSRYYVCYAKKWHKWRASSAMYSTVSIHFHPKRIICEIHPTKRWNGKIKRKKNEQNSAEKFVVQINILITFWVSPVIKNQERDWIGQSQNKKRFVQNVWICACVCVEMQIE